MLNRHRLPSFIWNPGLGSYFLLQYETLVTMFHMFDASTSVRRRGACKLGVDDGARDGSGIEAL